MGVGFLEWSEPDWYSVALFCAVWCCLAGVVKSNPSWQLFSLRAAGCGLLAYVGWYYNSWLFFRWYPEERDVTYCMGLIDGNYWDAALLLVLIALFLLQLWRLGPVIRARLLA